MIKSLEKEDNYLQPLIIMKHGKNTYLIRILYLLVSCLVNIQTLGSLQESIFTGVVIEEKVFA